MRAKPKPFVRRTSKMPMVLFGIGGAVVVLVVIWNVMSSREEESAREAQRAAARAELPALCDTVEKLAGELKMAEAQELLAAFRKKHARLAGDQELEGPLTEAASALEARRESAFKEDWDTFRRAYKARNFSLCRSIAEGMRRYVSAEQAAKLDKALAVVSKAEHGSTLEAQLGDALTQSERLVASRKFREAEKLLERFAREHDALDRNVELSARFKQAVADISRQEKRLFDDHWGKLLVAVASGKVSQARTLLAEIEAYGTAEQIRQARAKVDDAKIDGVRTSEAVAQATKQAAPRAVASPIVRRTPDARPPRSGPSESPKTGRKDREEALVVTREEVESYLREVRRTFRRDLGTGESRVTGSVTVFPDTLAYRLAAKAAEMLKTGDSSEEVIKALRHHVTFYGKKEKGRPIIEIDINVADPYGLFFPKGDIVRNFVVKYDDDTVHKTESEKNRSPRFETWTVYTRDRNEIPRRAADLWLLQGGFHIVLAVAESWKAKKLSVYLAGVWGLNKFKPRDSDWPGWNPERKMLQRYKRVPIDFRTEEVVYYAKDRDSRAVPLPGAIKALAGIGEE